jgi:G3E family GTPase
MSSLSDLVSDDGDVQTDIDLETLSDISELLDTPADPPVPNDSVSHLSGFDPLNDSLVQSEVSIPSSPELPSNSILDGSKSPNSSSPELSQTADTNRSEIAASPNLDFSSESNELPHFDDSLLQMIVFATPAAESSALDSETPAAESCKPVPETPVSLTAESCKPTAESSALDSETPTTPAAESAPENLVSLTAESCEPDPETPVSLTAESCKRVPEIPTSSAAESWKPVPETPVSLTAESCKPIAESSAPAPEIPVTPAAESAPENLVSLTAESCEPTPEIPASLTAESSAPAPETSASHIAKPLFRAPESLQIEGLSVTDSSNHSFPHPINPPMSVRHIPAPRHFPQPHPVPPTARPTLRYRSPKWRIPNGGSPSLAKLKPQAFQLKPLTGASEAEIEDLLSLVSEERKRVALDHNYRDGTKYNTVVTYVSNCFTTLKKRNRQQEVQEEIKNAEAVYRNKLDTFDRETERGIAKKRDELQHQKEELLQNHQIELDGLEKHWGSPKQFRQYNRASNKLTILRRQLSFLLVQCRFKDAEEVRRLVDKETHAEEEGNHGIMQRDYNAAVGILLEKQKGEIGTFEERAEIHLQKYLQERTMKRRQYENEGRKLAARREIAADPERLWNHEQGKRSHAITRTKGMPFVPSAKMRRKDFQDNDVTILSLPPLAPRRKKSKNEKERNMEENRVEIEVGT